MSPPASTLAACSWVQAESNTDRRAVSNAARNPLSRIHRRKVLSETPARVAAALRLASASKAVIAASLLRLIFSPWPVICDCLRSEHRHR